MPRRSLPRSLVFTLVAVLLGGLAGLPSAHAAVGDLDPLNLMLDERVSAAVAQPDGKTILVGRFTSVLGAPRNRIARLNADGSLDSSFNPDVNSAGATVECVAVQADFIPPATFTAPASGIIRHTDRSPGDSTRFYRTIPNP